jgi:hypothetical protein
MQWHVRQNVCLAQTTAGAARRNPLGALVDIRRSHQDRASSSRIFLARRRRVRLQAGPLIPELLAASRSLGRTIDLEDVTYYVGHATVIHRDDGMGLPAWQEAFFA